MAERRLGFVTGKIGPLLVHSVIVHSNADLRPWTTTRVGD